MRISRQQRQLLIVLIATLAIACELFLCAVLVKETLKALDDGSAHRPSDWQLKRR